MNRIYLLLFVCLFLSACQATVQEKERRRMFRLRQLPCALGQHPRKKLGYGENNGPHPRILRLDRF